MMNITLQENIFPLRNKFLLIFIIFFLLVILASIYLITAYRITADFFQNILDENSLLKKLSEELQSLIFFSEKYLSLGREKDLKNFKLHIKETEKILTNLNKQKYPELYFMVEKMLSLGNKTVDNKNYNLFQEEFSTGINLVQEYIMKLIYDNNNAGNTKYTLSVNLLKHIERKSLLLSVCTGLLSVMFIIYFTVNITNPLQKIMQNAKAISKGNFDVSPVKVKTNDELKNIALVFNQMGRDIKKLFSELKKKIKLERELQKEKMENLKMSSLLREAELKRLQSQINPHFLYNTLNTISQVAILEDADQTGELIKKIAKLLRYNLHDKSELVPVATEIEYIYLYAEIMEIRVSNKVYLNIDCPQNLHNYLIPKMLLQPVVENSYLHGIDQTGEINIRFQIKNGYLLIRVIDNGKGIAEDEVKKILTGDDESMSGLNNVKERLELIYSKNNLFALDSRENKYTEVRLKIPLQEEK